jgi:hypothetical protein
MVTVASSASAPGALGADRVTDERPATNPNAAHSTASVTVLRMLLYTHQMREYSFAQSEFADFEGSQWG